MNLSFYKSTSNGKVFGLSSSSGGLSTFFGNVEQNDNEWNPNSHINFGCISSEDGVLHNLYDSSQILFHNIAARRHKYPYLDEYDYQHIYRATSDVENKKLNNTTIKSIVQTQNTFYGIDSLGTHGHYFINDSYYEWLAQDNGYACPVPFKYNTLLYNGENVSSGNISAAISAVVHGIQYNTLYEIPGNIQQDYKSGTFIGNTVKLKNQYNYTYSMLHDGVSVLSNARDYYEICNCNDLIYLKYKDNKVYLSDKINNKDSIPVSIDDNYSVTHISAKLGIDSESTYKLPLIEVLTHINRGASSSNHKSSLYSLTLDTQFLKAINNQSIKENLRSEIKNCIRQIVEKIAPANTQLFSVTVN